MTSRCSGLALVVVVSFLVFLPGCHHDIDHSKQLGPLQISLSYNNGSCQQNGSSGIIDVFQNQAVTFQGATALSQFQVQFTTCPFRACPVNSPNGTAVNAGQPNPGAEGNTYQYSGLTINNQQCNLASPMGLRVKPGP